MLIKKQSPIHGQGIFTTEEISLEEVFYKVPLDHLYDEPMPRCAHIGGTWVSDEQVLNYVNHSCEPNATLDTPLSSLRARRDIMPGEEITVDYSLTEQGGTEVPCNCKAKTCRGYFLRIEDQPKSRGTSS